LGGEIFSTALEIIHSEVLLTPAGAMSKCIARFMNSFEKFSRAERAKPATCAAKSIRRK